MFYNCIAASCGTFIPAAATAAAAILVVAVVFVVNFIVIALIVVLVITVACHEMLLAVARRIALPTIASQSVSPQMVAFFTLLLLLLSLSFKWKSSYFWFVFIFLFFSFCGNAQCIGSKCTCVCEGHIIVGTLN